MEFYTESINDSLKKTIRKWAELAKITYNIGLIKSREIVLFQDLLDGKKNILISDRENEVTMSQDIMDFLSSGDSKLVLAHNHGGKETCFSNRDIEALIDYPRISYMIVINSKHEIFILGKSQQTKSRQRVMELFWDWWSASEKYAASLRSKTAKILAFSPLAIHADFKEYESIIRIEDEVIRAMHNMTSYNKFLDYANNAGFHGAYLYNEVISDKI